MMSENRFILCQDDLGLHEIRYDDEVFHFLWEVAPILNEQQTTIKRLEGENKRLREIITEMKDIIYMLQEVYVIGEYSSEIGEDMQELQKAYNGNLEDFLKYFRED